MTEIDPSLPSASADAVQHQLSVRPCPSKRTSSAAL